MPPLSMNEVRSTVAEFNAANVADSVRWRATATVRNWAGSTAAMAAL